MECQFFLISNQSYIYDYLITAQYDHFANEPYLTYDLIKEQYKVFKLGISNNVLVLVIVWSK